MIGVSFCDWSVPTEADIVRQVACLVWSLNDEREIFDWPFPCVGSRQYEIYVEIRRIFVFAISNLPQESLQSAVDAERFKLLCTSWVW